MNEGHYTVSYLKGQVHYTFFKPQTSVAVTDALLYYVM